MTKNSLPTDYWMEIKSEGLCVGKRSSRLVENGCCFRALSFTGWAGVPFRTWQGWATLMQKQRQHWDVLFLQKKPELTLLISQLQVSLNHNLPLQTYWFEFRRHLSVCTESSLDMAPSIISNSSPVLLHYLYLSEISYQIHGIEVILFQYRKTQLNYVSKVI